MSRSLVLPAAIIAATLAVLPVRSEAATLSLVGASTKICQLTGDSDWASGQPTNARTLTNYGLDSVDLGFPVDTGAGPLFFLFGDAIPNGHPIGSIPSVPPDDALGWTTRTAPPDPNSCLDMRLVTAAPLKFAHPTVFPPIKQGTFNVPSGGIFLDRNFYAFFWTDHCALPGTLAPDPQAPLTIPPPNAQCAENSFVDSVGRSVLARATEADPIQFRQTEPSVPVLPMNPLRRMPSGFVYVSAAQPAPEFMAPTDLRRPRGIPVFGAARYRASIPYLAIAPRETFGDPQTWTFFAGRDPGGNPVWVTRQQWESGRNMNGSWAPPPGAEIYDNQPQGERCVGEHSVTWNAPLHTWLLLYNCAPWTVEARFAPEPWGPWSQPTVMISAAQDPGVVCTIIMSENGCGNLRSYWKLPNGKPWPGIFYAPFVMNRYTRDATPPAAGPVRRATIYWLLSTWNPYAVIVMQSTLELVP